MSLTSYRAAPPRVTARGAVREDGLDRGFKRERRPLRRRLPIFRRLLIFK